MGWHARPPGISAGWAVAAVATAGPAPACPSHVQLRMRPGGRPWRAAACASGSRRSCDSTDATPPPPLLVTRVPTAADLCPMASRSEQEATGSGGGGTTAAAANPLATLLTPSHAAGAVHPPTLDAHHGPHTATGATIAVEPQPQGHEEGAAPPPAVTSAQPGSTRRDRTASTATVRGGAAGDDVARLTAFTLVGGSGGGGSGGGGSDGGGGGHASTSSTHVTALTATGAGAAMALSPSTPLRPPTLTPALSLRTGLVGGGEVDGPGTASPLHGTASVQLTAPLSAGVIVSGSGLAPAGDVVAVVSGGGEVGVAVVPPVRDVDVVRAVVAAPTQSNTSRQAYLPHVTDTGVSLEETVGVGSGGTDVSSMTGFPVSLDSMSLLPPRPRAPTSNFAAISAGLGGDLNPAAYVRALAAQARATTLGHAVEVLEGGVPRLGGASVADSAISGSMPMGRPRLGTAASVRMPGLLSHGSTGTVATTVVAGAGVDNRSPALIPLRSTRKMVSGSREGAHTPASAADGLGGGESGQRRPSIRPLGSNPPIHTQHSLGGGRELMSAFSGIAEVGDDGEGEGDAEAMGLALSPLATPVAVAQGVGDVKSDATPALAADGAAGGKGGKAGVTAAAAVMSVGDHVAGRVGRNRHREQAWSSCYIAFRLFTDRLLFTVRFALTAILLLLGVLFQQVFPHAAFGENRAFQWMYMFGGTLGVLYPLEWAEAGLYYVVDRIARCAPWLNEATDFARAGRGHLAHIGALIFALLLKTTIFNLNFSSEGDFYFVRNFAALLFLKSALIARNLVLKALIRTLYRIKHLKMVADVLFYVETARALTGVQVWRGQVRSLEDRYDGRHPWPVGKGGRAEMAMDGARFAAANPATPTHLLEGESFWAQASYVKNHHFSLFAADGELIDVLRAEAVTIEGANAFDRLYAARVVTERRRLKKAIWLEVTRDVASRGRVDCSPTKPGGMAGLEWGGDGGLPSATRNVLAVAGSDIVSALAIGGLHIMGSTGQPVVDDGGGGHGRGDAVMGGPAAGRQSGASHGGGPSMVMPPDASQPSWPSPGVAGATDPPTLMPLSDAATSTVRGTLPPSLPAATDQVNVVVVGPDGGGGAGREQGPSPTPAPPFPPARWSMEEDPFYVRAPRRWQDIPDVPDVSRWEALLDVAEAEALAADREGWATDAAPVAAAAGGDGGVTGGPALTDPAVALSQGARVNLTVVELEQRLAFLALEKPALTFDEVRKCFRHTVDAVAAFRLLDLDGDNAVTRTEFINSLMIMFHAWTSTRTSLQSYGGISGAIRVLTNVVYWIMLFLIILAIYQIDFFQVWAPITSVLLVFGFSVAPTLQRTLDSLMLILIITPYDVGDQVMLPGVSGNTVITVAKIYLTATEFVDTSNRRIIARNADIINQPIINLRRSGPTALSLKWSVNASLTALDLDAIRSQVEEYVLQSAVKWKASVAMMVETSNADTLQVTFRVTHRAPWTEVARVTADQTDLILFINTLFRKALNSTTAAKALDGAVDKPGETGGAAVPSPSHRGSTASPPGSLVGDGPIRHPSAHDGGGDVLHRPPRASGLPPSPHAALDGATSTAIRDGSGDGLRHRLRHLVPGQTSARDGNDTAGSGAGSTLAVMGSGVDGTLASRRRNPADMHAATTTAGSMDGGSGVEEGQGPAWRAKDPESSSLPLPVALVQHLLRWRGNEGTRHDDGDAADDNSDNDAVPPPLASTGRRGGGSGAPAAPLRAGSTRGTATSSASTAAMAFTHTGDGGASRHAFTSQSAAPISPHPRPGTDDAGKKGK